ncbi:MAG: hypothetical protein J7647_01590 [Cyanobacteria bacterium SBLK]|nr:hypothetical protein [Cyanobacteria bacterium SBLK]
MTEFPTLYNASSNYKPDREMCDRFQTLGLSVAEFMILTAQLEVEETWDIKSSLEMMTRHPEAIKLDVLEVAIAYRNLQNVGRIIDIAYLQLHEYAICGAWLQLFSFMDAPPRTYFPTANAPKKNPPTMPNRGKRS